MPKNIKIRKDDAPAEPAATTNVAAQPAQPTAEEAALAEAEAAAATVQDDFQARGFELVEWVQEHRSMVLGALGLFVVAGLAFAVYGSVRRDNAVDGSAAFAAAYEKFSADIGTGEPVAGQLQYADIAARNQDARTAFASVASQYKGSGAGRLAQLYLGKTSLELSEWDVAIGHYRSHLDNTASDEPLRFSAYSGIAIALENKGDVQGAIDSLEASLTLTGDGNKQTALFELGRLYKKLGDKTKAKARWQSLIDTYPTGGMRSQAEAMIASLDAPPRPVKVAEPDTDRDGIADVRDNCPKEKGTPENAGCAAAQLVRLTADRIEINDSVYFKTGSAVIEARSYPLLDNVAGVLNAHDEVKHLDVEGHTDNAGNPEKNLQLSKDRAAAVKVYLTKKGVPDARLGSDGFGDAKPIADNTTPEGKAKNRRVDFRISH